MNTNITYDLHLKILTPVHIGASTEKKWLKGVDYYKDNNGYINFYDINQLKSIDENTIDYITSVILINNRDKNVIKEIISNRKIKIAPLFTLRFNKEPDEIFAHIRNGLNIPYIPGSSLKGAIRSAILGYLYQNDNDIKKLNKNNIDDGLFGDVHNSTMRFLQVTDSHFTNEDISIYNTKIYSLNYQKHGAWKHKQKGSDECFRDEGFVSTYECIEVNKQSTVRINITEKIIKSLNNNKPNYTEKIIAPSQYTDPLTEIFRMINEQTKLYLKKEIEFFEIHRGDKHEIILEQYKSLEEIVENFINKGNKQTLLHLGSGSGFHGITGDWWFNNHIITGINQKNQKNRGQINNEDAAKTRRLIFKKIENDEYLFTPFGFIVLGLNNESLNEINTYFEATESSSNFSFTKIEYNKKVSDDYNTQKSKNEKSIELQNYVEYTKNFPVITSLNEINNNKYVIAEVLNIEKGNVKAKVIIENVTIECQLQGKLVKYLQVGQKIKAKITSWKDKNINSISINI